MHDQKLINFDKIVEANYKKIRCHKYYADFLRHLWFISNKLYIDLPIQSYLNDVVNNLSFTKDGLTESSLTTVTNISIIQNKVNLIIEDLEYNFREIRNDLKNQNKNSQKEIFSRYIEIVSDIDTYLSKERFKIPSLQEISSEIRKLPADNTFKLEEQEYYDGRYFIFIRDYELATINILKEKAQQIISILRDYLSDDINSGQKQQKKIKKLESHFYVKEPQKLVELLKQDFATVKGKKLKILWMVLLDLGIIVDDNNRMSFYRCMKNEVNNNLGAYQTWNEYVYNERIDENTYKLYSSIIEPFK